MEKLEERVERLERLAEYFIEEMADFKKWVVRFLSEYKREVDRQIREYKEDTNKKIEEYRKENNKRWGELANKLGTIVEDIIYPAFKEKANRFLQYFPEFAGKKLILIMASLSFNEDFIKQLSKANIYAMAYREWEYMDILNFEEVKDA